MTDKEAKILKTVAESGLSNAGAIAFELAREIHGPGLKIIQPAPYPHKVLAALDSFHWIRTSQGHTYWQGIFREAEIELDNRVSGGKRR